MSVLIAILYPNQTVADDVLEGVENLSREGLLDTEDACAVIKDANGKIHLHQKNNLSLYGAIAGLTLGALLGFIVLLPYLAIPGAIIGAVAGRMSDWGIPDDQMKNLGKEMAPGTSALFLLLRNTAAETVVQELAPYGGRIFHTTLEKAEEIELEEKLEQLRNMQKQEVERSPDLHD